MKVGFDGFEAKALTFEVEESVSAGDLLTMYNPGVVIPCEQGDEFIGIALTGGDDFVTVQVKGVMTLYCDETNIDMGLNPLAAGENNKVVLAPGGTKYWVIDKNTTEKTITVLV